MPDMPDPTPEQKKMLQDLAHDLRTPLAVMKTDTEVALMSKNLDDETRKTLENMLVQLDRFAAAITKFLG
jgi:signal transduction histidine kinase